MEKLIVKIKMVKIEIATNVSTKVNPHTKREHIVFGDKINLASPRCGVGVKLFKDFSISKIDL